MGSLLYVHYTSIKLAKILNKKRMQMEIHTKIKIVLGVRVHFQYLHFLNMPTKENVYHFLSHVILKGSAVVYNKSRIIKPLSKTVKL